MKATLVMYVDMTARTPGRWMDLAGSLIAHVEKYCDFEGNPLAVIHAETLDHGDVDEEDRPWTNYLK